MAASVYDQWEQAAEASESLSGTWQADRTQCGYSARGCSAPGTGGWHDCHIRGGHGGSHKCGNCGNSF